MRVVTSKKHISLRSRLAKESNRLAGRFSTKSYSNIENIDSLLARRDISVEKKKGILLRKLHEAVARAFSINKKKFGKKDFESLKKQLQGVRKTVIKLRNINYYLETAFLEELHLAKSGISGESPRLERKGSLAADELEALEFTAYKFIEEAVVLDKRLLSEYSHREAKVLKREKAEAGNLRLILKKESELLEHLEAKLPPPKSATISLIKEPTFTHWVSRIFALLSYLENLCDEEAEIFGKLKKNKLLKSKISKKISQILKEKSKLLKIMEEKAMSMEKIKFRRELHNFTTAIRL